MNINNIIIWTILSVLNVGFGLKLRDTATTARSSGYWGTYSVVWLVIGTYNLLSLLR